MNNVVKQYIIIKMVCITKVLKGGVLSMDIVTSEEHYKISEGESVRISVLKVLLSVLVVYVHSYATEIKFTSGNVNFIVPEWLATFKYVCSHAIAGCAVPGFFFLAAILLYRKEFFWRENMFKKLRTLLVPYILLNTFWIFVFWVGQSIPRFSVYFANPDNIVSSWGIYGWLKAYGLVDPGKLPLLYQMWFVRNLVVLNVLAVVLKKIIDIWPKGSLVFAMILWFVPLGIDGYTKSSLTFWILGYLCVVYNIRDEALKGKFRLIVLSYIVLLALDCLLRDTVPYSFIHHLTVMFGIVFFYICSMYIVERQSLHWVSSLATFSITIYFFHEMSLGILRKICGKIFPATTFVQFTEYVFIPIVIVIWCILLSLVLRQLSPRIYNLLTGNRGW
ncbi:MAG: acyltransferase family protein [Bacillota bacterium]|nr:acyltransferase family protein [Bacillota bacterium]